MNTEDCYSLDVAWSRFDDPRVGVGERMCADSDAKVFDFECSRSACAASSGGVLNVICDEK